MQRCAAAALLPLLVAGAAACGMCDFANFSVNLQRLRLSQRLPLACSEFAASLRPLAASLPTVTLQQQRCLSIWSATDASCLDGCCRQEALQSLIDANRHLQRGVALRPLAAHPRLQEAVEDIKDAFHSYEHMVESTKDRRQLDEQDDKQQLQKLEAAGDELRLAAADLRPAGNASQLLALLASLHSAAVQLAFMRPLSGLRLYPGLADSVAVAADACGRRRQRTATRQDAESSGQFVRTAAAGAALAACGMAAALLFAVCLACRRRPHEPTTFRNSWLVDTQPAGKAYRLIRRGGGHQSEKVYSGGGHQSEKVYSGGGHQSEKVYSGGGHQSEKVYSGGGHQSEKVYSGGGHQSEKVYSGGGHQSEKMDADGGHWKSRHYVTGSL